MLPLLLLLLSCASVSAMTDLDDLDTQGLTLQIPSKNVRTHHIKDPISLYCDDEGFLVKKGDELVRVNNYDIDPTFRGRDMKDILKYTALDNKFRISECDNGEYKVSPASDLRGGGIFGAQGGFLLGKFLVHFVGQGVIQIAALCTGPAYPATVVALEATFLPFIEAASNVVALGTGVAGAVITGPV